MLRVSDNVFVGLSTERLAMNYSPGDVFVETDTAQTYVYTGRDWRLMGLDKAHAHDTRYYQKSEVYTKAEVDAIVVAGGTVDWVNVINKPTTATRWPGWTEVTGKPTTATRWPGWTEVTGKPTVFSPDPTSTAFDTRYYTKAEMDALLATKQPLIIINYGDSVPPGTNDGDMMYWVNSVGVTRLAVWGTTESGGTTYAWRVVTLV